MADTLTITRVFDAPRELVFAAWTDPKHIANWWGPRGFTNPVCAWNATPGGKIAVTMRANDEIAAAIGMKDHPMGGEFREVVPPSKLVFITTAFDGPDGPKLRNLNTVTFEAQGARTKVTLHVVVEHAAPQMQGALSGMEQGWSESLDKLAEYLARF
ncbi:MAG: SRPBCC domain-containing protein [Rhizomicrobium sp.]